MSAIDRNSRLFNLQRKLANIIVAVLALTLFNIFVRFGSFGFGIYTLGWAIISPSTFAPILVVVAFATIVAALVITNKVTSPVLNRLIAQHAAVQDIVNTLMRREERKNLVTV